MERLGCVTYNPKDYGFDSPMSALYPSASVNGPSSIPDLLLNDQMSHRSINLVENK